MNEQEIQQTAINVYGLANIGCSMENPTFQTLVINNDGSQEAVAEEMTEDEYEVVDLKFFDIKRFGTKERQKAFLHILEQVLPKMDVDSGRDWVALYIAYHYYINKLVLTKGYADFFTDIERLLPGILTKVKQQEAKGDKRYKQYTEALASECGCWFIVNNCLPVMDEWRLQKYNYRVDDDRRGRIQDLVKEIYQGLKEMK